MKRRAVIVAIPALGAISGLTLAGYLGDDRIDERGDIDVVVDGDPIDLSQDRFQAEHAENHSIDFHLHEGDDRWFMEGTDRVTVAEAIDLLPHFAYEMADGDRLVTVDGTTYDEGEPEIEMAFLVDGDSVDPDAYELQDGDSLLVEIDTDA